MMFNPSIVICLNALGFPFSTDKSMVCSVFGPFTKTFNISGTFWSLFLSPE